MVLGLGSNSVFPTLRRLVRFGLGGKMGSGRQYVSWIHEVDFCRAVEWLIAHETLTGPVTIAAPNPIPNREMMKTLREVCGVPFGLPATEWMLELGAIFLRTETELIIKSRRIIPKRFARLRIHISIHIHANGLPGFSPKTQVVPLLCESNFHIFGRPAAKYPGASFFSGLRCYSPSNTTWIDSFCMNCSDADGPSSIISRSEEHTSELQSRF